jgi:hypothetical protein
MSWVPRPAPAAQQGQQQQQQGQQMSSSLAPEALLALEQHERKRPRSEEGSDGGGYSDGEEEEESLASGVVGALSPLLKRQRTSEVVSSGDDAGKLGLWAFKLKEMMQYCLLDLECRLANGSAPLDSFLMSRSFNCTAACALVPLFYLPLLSPFSPHPFADFLALALPQTRSTTCTGCA